MTAPFGRATKSGSSLENHNKVQRKYNEERAEEVSLWVNDVLGEASVNPSGKADDFFESLKDGVVLCRLANELQPGCIKKIETSKMAFKCMENINNFTRFCSTAGVPASDLFQSVDLWERQNLNAVVICLESLGRKAAKFGKPSIGPKESEKNVRNFTEDQLRAGDGMISLQCWLAFEDILKQMETTSVAKYIPKWAKNPAMGFIKSTALDEDQG